MKRPFKVFPSIAYRNSQFQVVSNVENLKIDFYDDNGFIQPIYTDSKNPVLLPYLNPKEKLVAKCELNNKVFEQEIKVKDAYRIGTSKLKKSFVFDGSEYSFFLMYDRLHIYDEQKETLLTENHYSPTEIQKIDKSNYLFVTRLGVSKSEIINLAIYNIESFSIVGELLNSYEEIKILSKKNKVWLKNIGSNSVHCFELVSKSDKYFTELKKYDYDNQFSLDDNSQNIFIDYIEYFYVSNLFNLNITFEIPKLLNNAVDKTGNVFYLEGNTLTIKNFLSDYYSVVEVAVDINLEEKEAFLHIGNKLKSKTEIHNINSRIEEKKKDIILSIQPKEDYHPHLLPKSEQISEFYLVNNIYPTIDGIFMILKKTHRTFNKIEFKKSNGEWTVKPSFDHSHKSSLLFLNRCESRVLIGETNSVLSVNDYSNPMLIVNFDGKKHFYCGCNKLIFRIESEIILLSMNEFSYILVKSKDKYTLYGCKNFINPILEGIDILNIEPIKKQEHKIIWYSSNNINESITKYLRGFNLKTCSRIFIDDNKLQNFIFKDASDVEFKKDYALTSNQVVFSPISVDIKDAFIGKINSLSKGLDKIVSRRENKVYLSIFNNQTSKYQLSEIPIDEKKIKESYLSPNGKLLVLKDDENKCALLDIENNKILHFISGNFLKFQNEGNLVVEEDNSRAVKIRDPKTLKDVTPPNYHYYKFMSPDGKLYTNIASKFEYFNELENKVISEYDFNSFKEKLNEPTYKISGPERGQISRNRYNIYKDNEDFFLNINISNHQEVRAEMFISKIKYLDIGFVNKTSNNKIHLPQDTEYFNYAAFSYDNQFIGIVGKPYMNSESKSLIMLCNLELNYENDKIEVTNKLVSREAENACWICGFSKKGTFAFYDSVPNTYMLKTDKSIFKESAIEYKNGQKVYDDYNKWTKIENKNFLCFSPSGNFLALSEQGYDPITKGGCGHIESSVLYIAETKTEEILTSFMDHGERLVDPKKKDIIFVSFSEDEKRLMSMSKDGVVIIRDIEID